MDMFNSDDLNIKFLYERGLPAHCIPVEINGKQSHAWLLTSINANNIPKRDTLAFINPKEVLSNLPNRIRKEWQGYETELFRLKSNWNFLSCPTLKRVIREYRDPNINLLSHRKLLTLFYRLGAVPVLHIGQTDSPTGEKWQVALLQATFEKQGEHGSTDGERLELLKSLEAFLFPLLEQYYQNIANYLRAIFFNAPDHSVLTYCLRIREILRQSIGEKIELIRKCPNRFTESYKLASQLQEQYEAELREAAAVDDFVHILVNYIYRFFCIQDRVEKYHLNLNRHILPACTIPDHGSSIRLMQDCADNLANADRTERILEELSRNRTSRPEWLQTMAEISTFMAEIVHFTKNRPLDKPRIFITHHFRVKDSLWFFDLAETTASKNNICAELVKGRDLAEHIRWSILARIWFCDHQVMFLPSSWETIDKKPKILQKEEDWVNLELFYGELIGRPQTFYVASPVNNELLSGFRTHLENYTDEKEIELIDDALWSGFIKGAKRKLSNSFYSKKYRECKLNDFKTFWDDFQKNTLDTTARDFAKVLCKGWCYFFNPHDWSVVQAMINLNLKGRIGNKYFSVVNISYYIQEKREQDDRFFWAKKYITFDSLERTVGDYLRKLSQFAFVLENQPFFPLLKQGNQRKYIFKLQIDKMFDIFGKQFGTTLTEIDKSQIIKQWLSFRQD